MAVEPMQQSSRRRGSAPGTPPRVVRIPTLAVVNQGEGGARLVAGVEGGGAGDSVDLTRAMTGVVAHALWQMRGGEEIANWVDAERLVGEFLGGRERKAEVVVRRRRAGA